MLWIQLFTHYSKCFQKELAVTEQQDSKKTLTDSGKAEKSFSQLLTVKVTHLANIPLF